MNFKVVNGKLKAYMANSTAINMASAHIAQKKYFLKRAHGKALKFFIGFLQ